MGYLILCFLLLLVSSSPSYSDEETSVHEENRNGSVLEVSNLSEENLVKINDLAKNISYSKGIYRENKDSSEEPQIRRSLLKKVLVVSESDIMRNIVQKLSTDPNNMQLLEELEYLVHQYDVAVNFAISEGIRVVAPLLFSPDERIASSAALVLGSSMQSNPTVQKIALEYGLLENLIELLEHKSSDVVSRVIFALSSLLRNFPRAQEKFIAWQGIPKLVQVLKTELYITTDTKLKVVNLFSDIVTEHKTDDAVYEYEVDEYDVVQEYDDDIEEIELIKRYIMYRSFESALKENDVCKIIPTFLGFEDFDTHQKTVAAMISLFSGCVEDFQDDEIIDRLIELAKLYDPFSTYHNPIYPVIDEELKVDLYDDIQELISAITNVNPSETEKPMLKDEL